MSETSYTQFFGDKKQTFALTPPLIVELERVTGRGIGAVARAVFSREFSSVEINETIRLGLIGGGTDPEEAASLIAAYVHGRPVMEAYGLAVGILSAVMVGGTKQKARSR